MGGRGRSSGVGARQLTIQDALIQSNISEIIKESTAKRESLISSNGGGGAASPVLYKKCACCKEYTIPANSEYETCSICGWIDDKRQNAHPNSFEGKNEITLSQAKLQYQKSK